MYIRLCVPFVGDDSAAAVITSVAGEIDMVLKKSNNHNFGGN